MGSTISIVNETNCILNIALKQATPIYYENKVIPGQTVKRDVGKIWFTVESRLWNGLNEYNDLSEIVAPISTMTTKAVMGLRGFAAEAGLVNDLVAKESQHVLIGKVILPVGTSSNKYNKRIEGNPIKIKVGANEASQKIIKDWIADCAARAHGIFMGTDKVIRIVGGPEAFIDEGKEYQYIENTESFTIIY